MEAYWGSEGVAPRILEWSASRRDRFTPRERAPDTRCIVGWVGPRTGLDAVVRRKIPTPYRDSNPPFLQPVDQCYTTELSRLFDVMLDIGIFIYDNNYFIDNFCIVL
jgi:hypothetical protein